jgi:hypothetical protein
MNEGTMRKIIGAAALAAAALTVGTILPGQAQEFPTTPSLPPAARAPTAPITSPLPIAPTNGLDQRLAPSLNTPPNELISVTPAAPSPGLQGIIPAGPGGSAPDCNIYKKEGLATGLTQDSCANVVNFPRANDILN